MNRKSRTKEERAQEAARQRAARAADPERFREYDRRKRLKHGKAIRARGRKYYRKNRESINARRRARRAENPRPYRKRNRDWRRKNSVRVNAGRRADYATNPQKYLAPKRRDYRRNPELHRALALAYYATHRDAKLAYSREYHRDHRESRNTYSREYRRKNGKQIDAKRSAKRAEAMALLKAAEQRRRGVPTDFDKLYDLILPLYESGRYGAYALAKKFDPKFDAKNPKPCEDKFRRALNARLKAKRAEKQG